MGKGSNWDALLVIDKMCVNGSQNMSRILQGIKGLVILRPMEGPIDVDRLGVIFHRRNWSGFLKAL